MISELLRKRPAPQVIDHLGSVPANALYTSVICVMELRYGGLRRNGRSRLWERIFNDVLPSFQVLPLGIDTCLLGADVLAHLESRGEIIGIEDVLIGATALQSRLTMVTRNVKHLQRIPDLQLESWW